MSDAQTNARWQMTPRNYFIQSSDWMAHDDRFAGMMTGLSIGKLTAMGSIVLIRTIVFRWPRNDHC